MANSNTLRLPDGQSLLLYNSGNTVSASIAMSASSLDIGSADLRITGGNLVFGGAASIRGTSSAISIGASGDTVNLNVSGVTYNVGALTGAATFANAVTMNNNLTVSGTLIPTKMTGTTDATDLILSYSRDTDNAKISFIDYGANTDWLTFDFGDDAGQDRVRFRFGGSTNVLDVISNSVTSYVNVAAPAFLENGTTLSGKYLGLTAQASDSAKLNGQSASYYSHKLSASYTSVTGDDGIDGWFTLFMVGDNTNTPVLCNIRAYAHTSASFIVSKGYGTSNAMMTVLNANTSSNNGSYKYIKGLRILVDGTVQVKLNGAGTSVQIDVQVFSSGSDVTLQSTLTKDTAAETVAQTIDPLVNGSMVSPGDMYVGTNKVWHQGNDGSGSGLDADTIDGVDSVTLRGGKNVNYLTFTVAGDANTYYPVKVAGVAIYGFNRYSITRGYNWAAPATWGLADGSHFGALTFTFEWSGDTGWGGNDHSVRVVEFSENYTNMVAGMTLSTGGLLVWLRGGGAQYRLYSEADASGSVAIYDGVANSTTSYTAPDNTIYAPRTDTTNVATEINQKYPVRGSGGLFVNDSAVWTAANDGSGSGLDADTVDSLQGSQLMRSDANTSTTGTLTLGTGTTTTLANQVDGSLRASNSYGYIEIAPKNVNYAHIYTDRPSFYFNTDMLVNGSKVWHAGNDGTGSGLDADTIDGIQLTGLVQTARKVNAGTGITGGGDLTVDRTVSFDTTWGDARYLGITAQAADSAKLGGIAATNYPRTDSASTMNVGLLFSATATAGPTSSSPTALSYSKLQSYGTFNILADTDGSQTEYLYLSAGYASGAAANGLTIGYTAFQWKGNTIWHAGNDGTGSGLDADLLDGLNSTQFLRSDVTTTISGGVDLHLQAASGSTDSGDLVYLAGDGTENARVYAAPNTLYMRAGGTTSLTVTTSSITYNGNTVWHAGNDGTGSGLDADKLDGLDSTSFARTDADSTVAGNFIINSATATRYLYISRLGSTTSQYARHGVDDTTYNVYYNNDDATGTMKFTVDNTDTLSGAGANANTTVFQINGNKTTPSMTFNNNTVWHAGNDGTGSGLDADLLDGLDSLAFVKADGSINMTGQLSLNNGTTEKIKMVGDNSFLSFYSTAGTRQSWVQNLAGKVYLGSDNAAGVFYYQNNTAYKIWNETNDGAGSTLDADSVDGIHASGFGQVFSIGTSANLNSQVTSGFYRLAGTPTNAPPSADWSQMIVSRGSDTILQILGAYSTNQMYFRAGNPTDVGGTGTWSTWHKLWHDGNMGSTSGLDADKLDGLDSASYMRTDANTSTTGTLTIGTGTTSVFTNQSDGSLRVSNTNGYIDIAPKNTGYAHIYTDRPAFYFNKDLQVNGYTVWHSNNDGSGSGLDADKLDSLDSTSFMRTDANTSTTGTLTATGTITTSNNLSFALLPYMSGVSGSFREGGQLNLASRLSGKNVSRNSDFIQNNLTGYSIYDNNGSGRVTYAIISDDTIPNHTGKLMRVTYSPTASVATSPGWGGFSTGLSRVTGNPTTWGYRAGNRYLFRVVANIPTGKTISFGTNSTGTGGGGKWLTSTSGTGNWQEYLYLLTMGNTGTFSSTGYWSLTGGTPVGTLTAWTANHAYTAGINIVPTTANGLYYTATAGTSTGTQPTWPTTDAATVQDKPSATWVASTAYAAGAQVNPVTANGYYYVVTTAGTSGTAEPTWTTTDASTLTDGTVTWTAHPIITWTSHLEKFTWDVALYEAIDLDATPDVDRAPMLNVGYKSGVDVNWGEIYSTGKITTDSSLNSTSLFVNGGTNTIQSSTGSGILSVYGLGDGYGAGTMLWVKNDSTATTNNYARFTADTNGTASHFLDIQYGGSNQVTLNNTAAGGINLNGGNVTVAKDLTVTGNLIISPTSGWSYLVFPKVANDPGFIGHYENNNASEMRFSVSDDADGTDFFSFGANPGTSSSINAGTWTEGARIASNGVATFKGMTVNGTATITGSTTISGQVSAGTGNTAGVLIGTNKIQSIASNELILLSDEIRLGRIASAWDYSKWAGLKYDDVLSIFYIGGPASANFKDSSTPVPRININFEGTTQSSFDGKVIINDNAATTIGKATMANGYLLLGTTTSGMSFDTNEIAVIGNTFYLETLDSSSIVLSPNATDVMTVSTAGASVTGTMTSSGLMTGTGGLNVPSGNSLYVGTNNSSTASFRFHYNGSNSYLDYNTDLHFRSGTTDRVIMTSTGSVGIGTVSPSYPLHVVGDTYSTGWVRVAGSNGLYFQDYGGGWNMTDTTWIRSYNSKAVNINNTMRSTNLEVGIGTTYTAANDFQVIGAGTLNFRNTIWSDGNHTAIRKASSSHSLDVYSNTAWEGINLQTSDDTLSMGYSFQNSAGAYVWSMSRVNSSTASYPDLVFYGGNNAAQTGLSEVLRLYHSKGMKLQGNAMIAGTSALNQDPTITLALGDADTGIRWNSDGNLDVMANNIAVTNITQTLITDRVDTYNSGGNYAFAQTNGRGVRFWNSDSYKIWMSTATDASWGGNPSWVPTDAANADYYMYFRMTGANRGWAFRNDSAGGTNAVITGDGEFHTKKGVRAQNFAMEYNTTEDSLDFVYYG